METLTNLLPVKQKLKQIALFIAIVCMIACVKNDSAGGSGGTTPNPPVEDPLVFTLNPDPGSGIMTALGATQEIIVNITSKMPSGGVKADLKLVKDLDGSVLFTQSFSSNLTTFSATFQNLSGGALCTGSITISSASSASNSLTKTFKIARK